MDAKHNFFPLFLYIGVTLKFTWGFKIQDEVPPPTIIVGRGVLVIQFCNTGKSLIEMQNVSPAQHLHYTHLHGSRAPLHP